MRRSSRWVILRDRISPNITPVSPLVSPISGGAPPRPDGAEKLWVRLGDISGELSARAEIPTYPAYPATAGRVGRYRPGRAGSPTGITQSHPWPTRRVLTGRAWVRLVSQATAESHPNVTPAASDITPAAPRTGDNPSVIVSRASWASCSGTPTLLATLASTGKVWW